MFFRQQFNRATPADYSNQAAFAQMDRARDNRIRNDMLGAAALAKEGYDWYADETGTSPISDQLREWGWMDPKTSGAYDAGVSPGVRSMLDQSATYATDPGYIDPDIAAYMPDSGGFNADTIDLAPSVTEAAGVADAATTAAETADTASSLADTVAGIPTIGTMGYIGPAMQLLEGNADQAALELAKKYLLSTLGPAGVALSFVV